jgi:hypothetical protein
MNPFIERLVLDNFDVIGGHDSLMREILECRILTDVKEKNKARRAKIDMIMCKSDGDGGDELPAFCMMVPGIGLVTCYEKCKEEEQEEEVVTIQEAGPMTEEMWESLRSMRHGNTHRTDADT